MVRDPWRRVSEVWAWLPSFRAVAETEHLPTAAKRLGLTPSALSRSVRNLEDQLGRPLFDRVGRRIVLNAEGELLLRALRDAMRRVHSGLAEIEGDGFAGPLVIASAGAVTAAYLLPALDDLLRQWPRLEPAVVLRDGQALIDGLVGGTIDVAFLSHGVAHPMLTLTHLVDEPNGIFCGRGHALYGRDDVTPDELRAYAFVAPPPDARGLSPEGWPPEIQRRVMITLETMHLGVQLCREGKALAVLPVGVAAREGDDLWKLPLDLIPPTEIFAVQRTPMGQGGRAQAVVDAVVARIEAGSSARGQ